MVRVSLYIGEYPVVHSGKHSHPNKYINFWWVYTHDSNYLFSYNAMVSSNIIPISVSVSGWYKQMFKIIFSSQCNGLFYCPN